MKRNFWIVFPAAVLAMTIAGCSTQNRTTTPKASPTRVPAATAAVRPSATASAEPGLIGPAVSAQPEVSAMPEVSVDHRNDTTAAEKITAEVDKLSEVESSQALVVGDTVVVALKFDAQYQGGMTGRVREMVEEKVKTAHDRAENIYVTADNAQMNKLGELIARAGEDIKNDVIKLVDDIRTTL